MLFEDLHLIEPLVRAVRTAGYQRPSPIQQQAIPHILGERDIIGCARTGTGKTAAFVLPILQLLERDRAKDGPRKGRHLRVLVLSPTRELAAQIGDSFGRYGKFLDFRHSVIFGGVGQQNQVDALRRGIDIVVATPGRLLDLMSQGFVKLDRLETFVLDEADRMLDMGFIHDVKKVVARLPEQRHTLLFSATMPEPIRSLADRILKHAVRVDVTPTGTTAERIDQSVYHVTQSSKRALLVQVLADAAITRVLVFTRTKHGANRLVEYLGKASVPAVAIHGNKSQSARERALAGFKSGHTRVLVATDIAARGIDIDGISHVINFDLPEVAESYVHRIGRTARAGAAGIAMSFCDPEEREYLEAIERLTRQQLPVISGHGFEAVAGAEPRHEPHHGRGAGGGDRSRQGHHGRVTGAGRGPQGRSVDTGRGSIGQEGDGPRGANGATRPGHGGASGADRDSRSAGHGPVSGRGARNGSSAADRHTPDPRGGEQRAPLRHAPGSHAPGRHDRPRHSRRQGR